MAQSLIKLYAHIIFSTRHRMNLMPKERLPEIHSYIGGIINNHGCHSIIVGGTTNHIHILCEMSSTISAAELLKQIKMSSSRWIKMNAAYPEHGFAWQGGYALFSVSKSQVNNVIRYIANQEAHHQKQDYKTELLAFLDAYEVEYDEDFLWD